MATRVSITSPIFGTGVELQVSHALILTIAYNRESCQHLSQPNRRCEFVAKEIDSSGHMGDYITSGGML